MAAPSDALSSTLSAALEQVSVGSAGSTVAATTTITALVDPATAARENETLLSALELSAASSLEHVLAREVAVSCGLAAGAGGVHGGGGSSGGVVDVPRLQEVLRQAEASIQATPHAWVNVTAASRIFDIGRSRVTAALGAAARVQRELERLAPPPSSSAGRAAAGEGRGPALLASLVSYSQVRSAVRLPAADDSRLQRLAAAAGAALLAEAEGALAVCCSSITGPHTAERQQRGSFSSAAAAAAEAAEAAAAAALAGFGWLSSTAASLLSSQRRASARACRRSSAGRRSCQTRRHTSSSVASSASLPRARRLS
mmetsp:Transcript_4331/g.12871  ORF Transcript_4331/g.12871 Transcript_4331/m.12871 type:complete len:314 (+) Transcript_4331:43-984(+)